MYSQNQNESNDNEQIQGVPQTQQQQVQGVPQIQQQGIPSNQLQGVPQLQQQQQQQQQQQVQGYPIQGYSTNTYSNNNNSNANYAMNNNLNMNNNFIPMQQQQQMPYSSQSYSAQGLNAQISMNSSISSGTGFRLIKFPESKPKKQNLETVSEGKENDKEKDTKLKLAAVIVTICDGSTYDSLFSSVKQDAGEGSRVAVYTCQKHHIGDLVDAIKSKGDINMSSRKDDLQLLVNDLNEIEDESCVAINYECCSECSDTGFHGMNNQQIINELQFFLKQGYLIMYSDFSLKAFIQAWNNIGQKTNLGPNPLFRTGTFSGSVTLNFNPYTLKTCISSQLQSVGELCPDQDFCTVQCMSSTVRYSINKKFQKSTDKLPYDIEILTTAQFGRNGSSCSIQVPDFPKKGKKSKDKKDKKESSNSGGLFSIFGWNKNKEKNDDKLKDETKDEKEDDKKKEDKELEKDIDVTKLAMKTLWGDAGHVVLDFSKQKKDVTEGDNDSDKKKDVLYGKILLSMTHWCELVKLGDQINDDVLFKVAAKNMGTSSKAYQEMQTTYESYGGKNASGQQYAQQQAWISKTANKMVQQQAPCNNMMNSNISKGGYY